MNPRVTCVDVIFHFSCSMYMTLSWINWDYYLNDASRYDSLRSSVITAAILRHTFNKGTKLINKITNLKLYLFVFFLLKMQCALLSVGS